MKKQQSLPCLSHLQGLEISHSIDALNELLKPQNEIKLSKLRQREQELRELEVYGPQAQRQRMGVLKYHMKKRTEKLERLESEYNQKWSELEELMDLSIKNAVVMHRRTDEASVNEILVKSKTLSEKKWQSQSDYITIKKYFDELTSQTLQKNEKVLDLKKEMQDIINVYTSKFQQLNKNYISMLKKVAFLDLETPKIKEQAIKSKLQATIKTVLLRVEQEILLEINQKNQELLDKLGKLWDECIPGWKDTRYINEQNKFTTTVEKLVSTSNTCEYFGKVNTELELLFIEQEEMLRTIVYYEPRVLFNPDTHRNLFDNSNSLFTKNKGILHQVNKTMIKCQIDLDEEGESLVEKYSKSMSECGIKSHFQVETYLKDHFKAMASALYKRLASNFEEAQMYCQKNHDLMTQLLVLISKIIQEEIHLKKEISHLFEKGNTVFFDVKKAFDHIKASVNKDMVELRDKLVKATTKKMADAVLLEFGNLLRTFDDDTKNIRDQCLKIINGQVSTITEILDNFHLRLCQVLEIQITRQHSNQRSPSRQNLLVSGTDDKQKVATRQDKYKCLPALYYDHHLLDTSLNSIVNGFEQKLDKSYHRHNNSLGQGAQPGVLAGGKKKLSKKNDATEISTAALDIAASGLQKETIIRPVLITSETLDQVKQSLQKALIGWFEVIYAENDSTLFDWKSTGLAQMEASMAELSTHMKMLQLDIDSLYRKSIFDIEENDIYKARALQQTHLQLSNHLQNSQAKMGVLIEQSRILLKQVSESLNHKIYGCVKQDRHELKQYVLQKLQETQTHLEQEYTSLLNGFNGFELNSLNNDQLVKNIEKCKKSIHERIRWYNGEVDALKEQLLLEVTKRIEYLEFWNDVIGQERSLRMQLTSNILKYENSFKMLESSFYEKIESTQEHNWDSAVDLLAFLYDLTRQIQEAHCFYSNVPVPDQKRNFVPFSDFCKGTTTVASSVKKTSLGKKETFTLIQEQTIKKLQEKIYEKCTDFYKLKLHFKCLDGIPTNLNDCLSLIDSNVAKLKTEVEAKRQGFINNLLKLCQTIYQEAYALQNASINFLDSQLNEKITIVFQEKVKVYQFGIQKAWAERKDDQNKLTLQLIESAGSEFTKSLEKYYEQCLAEYAKQLDYVCFIVPISLDSISEFIVSTSNTSLFTGYSTSVSTNNGTNAKNTPPGDAQPTRNTPQVDQTSSRGTPQIENGRSVLATPEVSKTASNASIPRTAPTKTPPASTQTAQSKIAQNSSQLFKVIKLNYSNGLTVGLFNAMDAKIRHLLSVVDYHVSQETQIISSLNS